MVRKFQMFYAPAQENRTIHVYLPDDYDETDERYPVLYMFDGHNMFSPEDATYGVCWGLKEFLDSYGKKMIVVGMECSHTGHNRLSEYSPYNFHTRSVGKIAGKGDDTMQWIVNIVKPYIDCTYRTWSHREATAIGGSSMGGLMSVYAVFRYNHIFSKAACVSPALGFEIRSIRKMARESSLAQDTRIFFSWGSQEYKLADIKLGGYIRDLDQIAQQKGVSTYIYRQDGGKHCEADWALQVEEWMDYLWR